VRDHGPVTLPAGLGPLLRGQLDSIVAEVITAVGAEVPLYSRPLEGAFGAGLRLGVSQALGRFAELVASGTAQPAEGLDVYRALGRGEVRQGRPLEALLAAYRVGARVSWRRFATVATDAGAGPEELVALAELVFAYIDELSSASAQGYAAEQSLLAGARDRSRLRLLDLLLRGGVDRSVLAAAAADAGWPLAAPLAVVLAPAGAPLAVALGPDALVQEGDGEVLALLPDAAGPGRVEALRRALAGADAVLGPVTAATGVTAGLARARRALRLRPRLGLAPGVLLVADEHRVALLLAADPALAGELAAEVLAPLAAESRASRERLEATLLAWLAHRGERGRAAASLHVHPQTVRYRLTRLRELRGDALEDPDRRFALELALRARG